MGYRKKKLNISFLKTSLVMSRVRVMIRQLSTIKLKLIKNVRSTNVVTVSEDVLNLSTYLGSIL